MHDLASRQVQRRSSMSTAAMVPILAVLSLGALWYLTIGRTGKKKRPTQHDLDPTLKKNQVRITTQKKAFRREDLPPEYLAQLDAAAAANSRRDVVELPMGAARPPLPTSPVSTPEAKTNGASEWLPDNLKAASGSGKTKRRSKQK